MPKKQTKAQIEATMKARGESWREDGMFQEFCTYHGVGDALHDPCSSGFSLLGAGGRDINEYAEEDDDFNEKSVIFYLEELDSGEHITARLTPESARLLAERLNQWANDAEGSAKDEDIEAKFEEQRRQYYANGGV